MIDQDQARKFWTNWVRREIGGNDMIQEAAVSAAVNELLLGHDNRAAADAARNTAHRLGGGESTPHPDPPPQGGTEIVATPLASVGSLPAGNQGQPLVCKLCGSTPAAHMTIHEHNGRLLWMVHKTNKGPFCRDCGTALLRHHQNSTLLQGWFGIFSFFITPVTLLLNVVPWRNVKALGPPQRDPGVESKIPAPLNPGKPVIRRPGPYVAGVVVAAVLVFLSVQAVGTGGCRDSQKALGNRMTRLHNSFVDIYNHDFQLIDACTSVDCERAPKVEIAGSLKTYNDGLDNICWPDKYKADVTALKQANNGMADAFASWATATTPAEDQSLQTAAKDQDNRQGLADDALSRDLSVPVTTPTPTPTPV